ncbi:DUF3617 domain-containing protein [Erythrobacter rubeus]|uniref:DUF3617 domain-containing protein n=1 Tax=Erythrobacter rubeus TaxID=2760803 RepID=A0ABR8KPG6_9SPHN|nr:DUF3617 domain-containing protein [Erythrobacter rubeus]MBD2841237.1 DUF3617 domain-containing protein [Erythrobacter rubeus]
MKYFAAPAIAAFALTACGSPGGDADTDGDGTVTASEARALAEAAGDTIRPEPGKYRASMTFVSADIPGAPPQMQDMMASSMSNTFEFCLTPEMAEQGFGEALQEGQDDSCTISKLNIDDTDVDMAMTCSAEGQGEMQIAMTGTVSPTRSEMNVMSEGNMDELGNAKMEMKLVQERIGECDA